MVEDKGLNEIKRNQKKKPQAAQFLYPFLYRLHQDSSPRNTVRNSRICHLRVIIANRDCALRREDRGVAWRRVKPNIWGFCESTIERASSVSVRTATGLSY